MVPRNPFVCKQLRARLRGGKGRPIRLLKATADKSAGCFARKEWTFTSESKLGSPLTNRFGFSARRIEKAFGCGPGRAGVFRWNYVDGSQSEGRFEPSLKIIHHENLLIKPPRTLR
jgi:hypothetical protein